MAKPISPKDITDRKQKSIPDAVIETVNALIIKNWDGHSATVLQEDIVTQLAGTFERADIFANKWLDFEGTFRRAGWRVTYDKPGYNESYDAYFIFSRKKFRGSSLV